MFTYVATLEEVLDKERTQQSLNNLIERMSGEKDKSVFVDSFENLQKQIEKGKAGNLGSN